MKKEILLNGIILLLLGAASCEGYKTISSTVISENTGEPIANAAINPINHLGDTTQTDSTGRFELNSGFISMMFGGPKFILEIQKEGYDTKTLKTKWGQDTIRLTPLKH